MRRRSFLAGLGSATAWPLAARAGQGVPRIGFLNPVSAVDADKVQIEAFEAGLRELGYVPGKTIEIEYRFADGREERAAELARELADLRVDRHRELGGGVYAAHRVTNTVPIVTAVNGDLVALGLAESLGHPGGNVTGLTYFFGDLMVKRIELLKQVKPAMSSVGVLVQQGYSVNQIYLRAMEAPVRALGVALEPIEIAQPSDCDRALSTGPGASIGGVAVFDPPKFVTGLGPAAIATAAARHGLPAAGRAPHGEGRRASRLWRRLCPHVPSRRDLRRQDPERREAGRHPDRAGDEVHHDRQPEDRQGARHRDSPDVARQRRRGDRMRRRTLRADASLVLVGRTAA